MALDAEATISLVSLLLNLVISLLVLWQNQRMIVAARRCETTLANANDEEIPILLVEPGDRTTAEFGILNAETEMEKNDYGE